MTGSPNEAEFWQSRLAAVVQDQKAWQTELDQLNEKIVSQAEQMAAAKRSHDAALEITRQELNDAFRKVLEDREHEIARLFGEVSKTHRQLHAVWSSLSWQATLPFRSITARMPRLARGLQNFTQRNPDLWGASAKAVRSFGRMLLLKSSGAEIQLPEPVPSVALPAIEPPAETSWTFVRQNWRSRGDILERLEPLSSSTAASPAAGDHVLFIGATWTTLDSDRIVSLTERGIAFSVALDGIVPLDVAASWMLIVLTHARHIFVADATARDRILRWAVLSDIYVSATVSVVVDVAALDSMSEYIEETNPVVPLKQLGRLFLPGITAPKRLPALELAETWCTDADPQVSILIVSQGSPRLTRVCVQHIWAHTSGVRYEIIIVDGSTSPADRHALSAMGSGVHVIGADRFFGEACNIAAERARASLLCLLGNDCFGQPGWLKTLVEALDADPSAGAAGPLLLSPDLTVCGAGGAVTEQGDPVVATDELYPRPVDYVSAACLLVSREAYLRAGGLDLMYEPISFEDIDFCFKLKALGVSVLSCPAAQAIQIGTLDDTPAAIAQHKALYDLNRDKFVSRWGQFLSSRSEADLAAIKRQICINASVAPSDEMLPTAALYTPYAITPGGGERFLLTIASELMRDHRVTIVTPHPYSQLRLQNIAHIFRIDLARGLMQTEAEFASGAPPDLLVVLGNYIYPPIVPRTSNAVFICQFPFPMTGHPRRIDQGYRAVIAYSEYARTHIQNSLSVHNMPAWPVEIVYPPVPQLVADSTLKRPIILTVGRFFTGDHSKRHDLMIDAFRRVFDAVGGEVEMHLAGSSTPGPEHMRYLETLMKAAEGMPVSFHVNASRETLEGLYRRASIYWHATGLGGDLANHPEVAEHFGISLVEAMSGECVSLAFDAGGPQEIITQGVDGLLYSSIDELVTSTIDILHPKAAARRLQIGRAAGERAKAFAPERFGQRAREILLTSKA